MDDNTNKLFEDFKTRDVLDGISADNFDSLKDEAFITESNKAYFEDLLRTGWLSGQLSSSGPMPNTAFITKTTLTTSNSDVTIFTPNPGEVFQVVGVGLGMDSGVTSGTAYLKMLDNNNSESAIVAEMATSGSIESFDNDWGGPLYIDSNISLVARYFKSGGFPTGDEVRYHTVFIRVR